MANPIIDSVAVEYPTGQTALQPGQNATIRVVAHDNDTRTVKVDVVVTDASGGKGTASVDVVVADPITITAKRADTGADLVMASPGVFTFRA